MPVSSGPTYEISARDRRRQRRLRQTGLLLCLGGLLAAVTIYLRAPASDDWADYLVSSGTMTSGNYKQYQNQMKQIGGESNVVAADFSAWFASLWHGRRLAVTVGILSLGGSVSCFLLAHLLNFPPAPDAGTGGPGATPTARSAGPDH